MMANHRPDIRPLAELRLTHAAETKRILASMLALLRRPSLYRVYALAWTALVLLLLLQSSSQPVIGPPAPPGDPPLEREILLLVGHIIAFSGLTTLWYRALSLNLSKRRALIGAVAIALILGSVTELAQALTPDRFPSWFDLATNFVVTLFTAWRINASALKPASRM